ncbi:MAG TPA: hypothetical protein VGS41_11320, partial [Chthonomonadales bacterium]|nr:hypothetical protein [Chthonomonadales bacterium]
MLDFAPGLVEPCTDHIEGLTETTGRVLPERSREPGGDVIAAFDLLLEAIRNEYRVQSEKAAQALREADFQRSVQLFGDCRALNDYKGEVDALRIKWSLLLRASGASGSKPRRKRGGPATRIG